MKATADSSGTQKGDPTRAAAAMIPITEQDHLSRPLIAQPCAIIVLKK